MRHFGFDIERVKEFHSQLFLAGDTDTFASNYDDDMLVTMHLEAASTARFDLEISQMESGALSRITDQSLSYYAGPVTA